jgi:hypothetical protein
MSTTIHMGCYARIDDQFGMAISPAKLFIIGPFPKTDGERVVPNVIKNQPWNFVIGADILRTKMLYEVVAPTSRARNGESEAVVGPKLDPTGREESGTLAHRVVK